MTPRPLPDLRSGDLYVGATVDPADPDAPGTPVVLPSHQLTTHGVIVGMTGSGKTGLGVVLLEEAMLSGIPALVLDPKGDMGNLLLNFPDLGADDFQPWMDPAEARRRELDVGAYAARTAETWREGLASWSIGGERMRALREATRCTIFTPGSSAGVPLSVLGSLEAPDLDWERHAETLRDEIEGFVSSLLRLADVAADPVTSPEHILLSRIVEDAWRSGRDLDLPGLVGQVQDPPFRKLGVFDLDSFFPREDRRELALRLNGLLASPSFASWLQGMPLDVERLLRTAEGRPRTSIVHLAHLSDAERQFVVTLLLSRLVTWMRGQPGTSELRVLVYMDEIYGFAPPTARPPSKKPILTIFKQGRAHGVGMVAATQNPVDLDYKTMANAGTWAVGRLQTERDKARILEGLRSAAGGVDVAAYDALIGGLDKRQFVLTQARSPVPTLFTSRWAMSYLRGALTRQEIRRLTGDAPERETAAGTAEAGTGPAGAGGREAGAGEAAAGVSDAIASEEDVTPVAPEVARGVAVRYLDPGTPWASEVGAVPGGRRLRAGLAARVHLRYDDRSSGIDHAEEWEAVYAPLEARFDPERAIHVDVDDRDLRSEAPEGVVYELTEAPLARASWFRDVGREIRDHLHRTGRVTVFRNEELDLYSRVGEAEADFRERCRRVADERADEEAAELRDDYATKTRRLEDARDRAAARVRELEVDVQQRRRQELVSGAGQLLGMFLGGRRSTRSLSGVASRRSMTRRTEERLRTAEGKLADAEEDLLRLEDELAEDLQAIARRWDEAAGEIESFEIGLEKDDISVDDVVLVWIPVG